ncbi:sigma-70 family RNA polymerase sigma factor [Virgibacillus doumboii]|uniref:sigma-70 family RNA polymerase sigma factor n=1 Tax=Virgibacillus doumboii TaxID=2697503 RepID=UPI0013E03240|nr:sigma-70 family RNA polymerase sigma factor [Virgibacillus doumboii]
MDNRISFEELVEQNKRRIHYQMHKMNIGDPHGYFFQEGLIALWKANESYHPDKGPLATYFNYTIRNRLIDSFRKEISYKNKQKKAFQEQLTDITDGNHRCQQEKTELPVSETDLPLTDPILWKTLKSQLTENQWKWLYNYIILDMSYKEITLKEKTTVEAVKSWGRQVRKKLRDPEFKKMMGWDDIA